MERSFSVSLRLQQLLLRVLLVTAVLFRLGYAASRKLVPDEAFYWLLSRHPAGGYLDHPPMVAYLIRLSTWVLGSQKELSVRFFAVAMGFGALLLLVLLSEMLIKDRRATLLLVVMWLASPLFAGLSTLMTPDVPVFFFSACALACAIRAVRVENEKSAQWAWVCFGLFCGLALMSKYTAVLLPASIVLALACSAAGRRHLRTPGLYLGAVVALAVFWPNIQWNAAHDWVSFKYQLHHGLATAQVNHWRSLGEYVGGQFLLWTPILLALGLLILATYVRRYRELNVPRQMLIWSAVTPLAFFGLAACRTHGEINWPAFAYFPLSLLTVDYIAAHWRSAAKWWAFAGIALALAGTILLQSPELVWKIVQRTPVRYLPGHKRELSKKFVEIYGWDSFGQELSRRADGVFLPVVCATHEDAGEAAFYMRGQPDVWCWNDNTRPTSLDYVDGRPDFSKVQAVLFVSGKSSGKVDPDAEKFCRRFGFEVIPVGDWTGFIFGHKRNREFTMCIRQSPTTNRRRPSGS